MYATTSKPFNVELNVTVPELQVIKDYPRQTWWNRSVGPVILTTALAPVALVAMGAGFLLLGTVKTGASVTRHLAKLSSSER